MSNGPTTRETCCRLPDGGGEVRHAQSVCAEGADAGARWKTEYLRLAYDQAAKSPDRSNQNGAVLLSGGVVGGCGCNTFPPGIVYTAENLEDRNWKLTHIEHAERNAIFAAIRNGNPTVGGILICPWAACCDCARAIVLSGVRKVIVHKQRMEMTPDRWKASVEVGLDIMRCGGVELEYVDAAIGGGTIIVNGEQWQP